MVDQTNSNLLADAVFEGGGVKGIALVGAVAFAEEKGYQLGKSGWYLRWSHCGILISGGIYWD